MSYDLEVWRRHSRVEFLALTVDFWWGKEGKLPEKMIQLFPAVKEFDLTMKEMWSFPISSVNRGMKSFKMWDLKRVKVLVKESSELIEVLRAVSLLKGKISPGKIKFEIHC